MEVPGCRQAAGTVKSAPSGRTRLIAMRVQALGAAQRHAAAKLHKDTPVAAKLRVMKLKGRAQPLTQTPIPAAESWVALVGVLTGEEDRPLRTTVAVKLAASWRVGKLIDLLAHHLGLPNTNNDPASAPWQLTCLSREGEPPAAGPRGAGLPAALSPALLCRDALGASGALLLLSRPPRSPSSPSQMELATLRALLLASL
jgi:hypothetical protein